MRVCFEHWGFSACPEEKKCISFFYLWVFFVPISRWFWSKQTYFYENVLSKFDSIFSWRIDTRWSSSKKNFFEFQFFFGSKTKFQISLILSVMGDKKWRIPLIKGSHMYRPFHKTLPRSIAFVNWISVRFYENGCRLTMKIACVWKIK